MVYEHKIIVSDDTAIWILQKDWWEMCGVTSLKMYFKRKVKQTRKTPVKTEESLRYNKNIVKKLCNYAFHKDFEELYQEWRDERKLSVSYKTPFNEASEKRVFNKLSKVTKKIAEAMLNNAIQSKWLILYDLQENEKEKILMWLREDKRKEDNIKWWFETAQDKIKAENIVKDIDIYLSKNPKIRSEAISFIEKQSPGAEWQFKEKLVTIKMRALASERI